MEKKYKITATVVLVGLVVLVFITAPTPKKVASKAASTDSNTQQVVSSGVQEQRNPAVPSQADLSKQIADEQAIAKQDEALAESLMQSANNMTVTGTSSLPDYSSNAPSTNFTSTTQNSPSYAKCDYSEEQTALQPVESQLQQIEAQIVKVQGEISAFSDSSQSAGSKWGYSASGYQSYVSTTLSAYDQQLSSLTTQEQSLKSQLTAIEAQYGC